MVASTAKLSIFYDGLLWVPQVVILPSPRGGADGFFINSFYISYWFYMFCGGRGAVKACQDQVCVYSNTPMRRAIPYQYIGYFWIFCIFTSWINSVFLSSCIHRTYYPFQKHFKYSLSYKHSKHKSSTQWVRYAFLCFWHITHTVCQVHIPTEN